MTADQANLAALILISIAIGIIVGIIVGYQVGYIAGEHAERGRIRLAQVRAQRRRAAQDHADFDDTALTWFGPETAEERTCGAEDTR